MPKKLRFEQFNQTSRGLFMKVFLALGFLTISLNTISALPPQYQAAKDLDAMVDWAKADPKVMSDLRNIDLENFTVTYGGGDQKCVASFVRKSVSHPRGWVGPAAPLVFSKTKCE